MARLYPAVFPSKPDEHNAEFIMFGEFGQLPANYHVFYSKKFKGIECAKEECETDFIVFDGKKFLLCIEVKGGSITYDGKQDAWFQNGRRMSKNPDRQAAEEKAAILGFLGTSARDMNVGWALCFPDCCLPESADLPAGVPADVILDQNSLLDLEHSVQNVEEYYAARFKRAGADSAQAQAIIASLTRGIGFVLKLGVRVARDYEQIIEVTKEQFDVLEDLEVNQRVAVKGYAGTGKTLLAQEFARRLGERGQSVLLLFFNRLVANTVRHGLSRDLPVECTTFHSLAKHLVDAFDETWFDEHKSKDEDFWSTELPMKLFDIPKEKLPHFDAVIVDEGQDFKREWYEFLECLLSDKERGRFIVFYDDNQDIFGHWSDLPWGDKGAARKVLTKNCRNTREIVKYIKTYYSNEMGSFPRSPEGIPVIERCFTSVKHERDLFVKDVTAVIKDGIQPGQIIVIPNREKTDSCISGIERIAGHDITWVGKFWSTESDTIRYAHIDTFKGLEADVVFLLDCDSMTDKEFRKTVYVEGSRARTALYVYRPAIFPVAK